MKDKGLSTQLLEDTELLWWGHIAHEEVTDSLVDRIQQRVLKGMGLIVLHSGHHSKGGRNYFVRMISLPGLPAIEPL
jgi:trehalose utilization protein